MIDPERYLRQIILAGVGEEGQRRLAASSATVGGDSLAQRIAATYCERAGFGRVEPGSVEVEQLSPREVITEPAAREVLAGSRAALRQILLAVGGERRS